MYSIKTHPAKGFSHVILIFVLLLSIVIGAAGLRVRSAHHAAKSQNIAHTGTNAKPAAKPPAHTETLAQPTATPSVPTPVPPPPTAQPLPTPAKPPKTQAPFTTTIQIVGDAACQSATLDALKLLSTSAPTHYATITANIGIIECATQGSGMFAYENPPRYKVGDATRNAGTVWYAGTIAHDAGHSRQYHDYLAAHPGQPVPSDTWTGEAAERACLDAQYDALSKIGGTQSQLDYVKNIINSQYYNVPYDQRWW